MVKSSDEFQQLKVSVNSSQPCYQQAFLCRPTTPRRRNIFTQGLARISKSFRRIGGGMRYRHPRPITNLTRVGPK